MALASKMAPCLWFDGRAEEAAHYYCGIFKNSKITGVSKYGEAGFEIHKHKAGTVLTVEFELDGVPFTALNGEPNFKFTEAISFQVYCKDQHEIDSLWNQLIAGGDPKAQQCGWLKDKYGVSWQIVPEQMNSFFTDHTSPQYQRVMNAMMKMKKLDIAELQRAYDGK